MKYLKEIGLYLLISVLSVSGLFSIVLLTPPQIGKLVLGIVFGAVILVGFCFVLFLINGFLNQPLGRPVIKVYKK